MSTQHGVDMNLYCKNFSLISVGLISDHYFDVSVIDLENLSQIS